MMIRRLRPGEGEAVVALWRAADLPVSRTDTIDYVERAATLPHTTFLVATDEGAIVGSAIGGFDGWRGNLYRVAVHPDYRRRGIARALVREVEGFLHTLGAPRITALVESSHPRAVGCWHAVGYSLDVRMVRYVRNAL